MTKEKQFSFLSKDGKTKIHAVKWMPESGEYRAVLQITHGMVEYIERYKPFAEFLNDQGVLVVGHDHLGTWCVGCIRGGIGIFCRAGSE